MIDFSVLRRNMVDGQVLPLGAIAEGLKERFGTVPRELFVQESQKTYAYSDLDLPLGIDALMARPSALAQLFSTAALSEEDNVLYLGARTGYGPVVMSPLVKQVFAVEENETLFLQMSENPLVRERGNLAIGRSLPPSQSYSLIVCEGAFPEFPDILLNSLQEGGRLIIVIREKTSLLYRVTLREGVLHKAPISSFFLPFLEKQNANRNFTF